MKTLLYGPKQDKELLQTLQEGNSILLGITVVEDREAFLEELKGTRYECVVVSVDGARGMLGVRAARALCPAIPIWWISNDVAFGPESYSCACSFFATRDRLDPAVVRMAIEQCWQDMERNAKCPRSTHTKTRVYHLDGDELTSRLLYEPDAGAFLDLETDFKNTPRYTPSGKPWVNAMDDDCPYGTSKYRDCGSCDFFLKERPEDLIGVCTNEQKRRRQNE